MREGEEEGREERMRYRSAAFALKSAHALAGVGSTHFPALGVDADALLSPAAVLYLLRFSGDVVTAEQTFVTGVVPPVRVVAAEILVTLAEVVRAAPRAARGGLGVTSSFWRTCAPTRRASPRVRLVTLRGASKACESQKICVSCPGLWAKRWRGKCCRTGRDSP